MPLPSTMTPIATSTLSTAAASVTFSNLPQTYTDLVLVVNGLGAVNTGIVLTFNGATTNFSNTNLGGNGSAAQSNRRTSQQFINLTYTSYFTTSYNGNIIAHIMNYANTTTYKTVLGRANNASIGTEVMVGLWSNTAAINDGSGNIGSGTTFTIYGIKAA
jgi:hypothetical protein